MHAAHSARADFPEPLHERQVMAAWERFLCGERSAIEPLRGLIRDSWSRCYNAGVDPSCRNGNPLIESSALDQLDAVAHDHADLIAACQPVLAEAHDFLSQSGTVILVTDPDGLIIKMGGDRRTLDEAKSVLLQPGARWGENDCGTNAIGTALSANAPVQVHAAEHFCEGIKRWTCSATVIRDPYDNTILGGLDVSGLSNTYNQHCLALVVAAATRIEGRLKQLNLESRHALMEACLALQPKLGNADFVLFDHVGRAVKATSGALREFAARGVDFEPSKGARMSHLGVSAATETGDVAVPAWLSPEAVEPVIDNGRQLGTMLVLPQPVRRKVFLGNAEGAARPSGFAAVLGTSAALADAVQRARQFANAQVPVLLLGETGVGKEVFAKAIHETGRTSSGPLITLNCGGLSRDLLASELFGYVDGAFTGAKRGGMKGKVEAAQGGTLFLDEIGELPLDLQPHLLRVLEGGEVYRLGDTAPRKADFRLIAATNRNLSAEVDAGRFRMDLFYRVSVTSIELPALRERTEDIDLLIDHFTARIARDHDSRSVHWSADARAAMLAHGWPGNVRELRNVVESAILTSPLATIERQHLPTYLCARPAPAARARKARRLTLEDAEIEAITDSIEHNAGNLTRIAQELGVSKSTLYAKIKKHALEAAVERARNA